MKKESEDPGRKFLIEALTLGLLAGFNLSGLVQPSFSMGALSKKLPPGKSIYTIEGQVIIDGNPANLDTVVRANTDPNVAIDITTKYHDQILPLTGVTSLPTLGHPS